MTLPSGTADLEVRKVLRKQGALITRSQALAAGCTESWLRNKLRPDGPWRVVLPGIYLASNGVLTIGQRDIAAVLHGGRGCVITGMAALRMQGVQVPITETVDILVPAKRKRASADFVRVHRTGKMPERVFLIDDLPYAACARAMADAMRGRSDLRSVTDVVAAAVQQNACTIQQLSAELRAGPKPGSASLRAALAAVADGVASVAEADFRRLVRVGRLPEPMYNPRLYAGDVFLAKPDAWWPDAGVAAEVDSREWHLSPGGWQRTMARHARMSAQGIIVLHFPPSRIRSDPAGIVAELRSAIEAGRRRAPLSIRAVIGR